MIAFDTDVLTGVLHGEPELVERVAAASDEEQGVPVVVVEETLADLQQLRVLGYGSQAHSLCLEWRRQRSRVGSHDLRIGAICLSHGATLISRNRKDVERIPGLRVDFWD